MIDLTLSCQIGFGRLIAHHHLRAHALNHKPHLAVVHPVCFSLRLWPLLGVSKPH